MTVSNKQVRASYIGDGISTSFPIPYPFYLDTDITIMLGPTVQSSGYSITGGKDANGNPQTGSVIFASAPPSAVAVQFILNVPLTQLVNLVDGTEFPSATLNQVNDRAFQALLRHDDRLSRTIMAPDGDVSPNLALPTAATRANTYPVFDSSGNLSVAQSLPSGTLSQATIGLFLYPRTSTEISTGVTPTNYAYAPFDLRRYGADSTGVVACDTAFNSAVSVCGTTGGTIRASAGIYTFASASTALNAKTSIIVQGDGAATGGVAPATKFQFSGTGSGVWFSMNSAVGVQFRGIQFVHTSASFTGTYFQCNNDGTHGDPNSCGLFDCTIGSNVGTGTTHLDINKCILFTAERCNFSYGNPSVTLAKTGGYSFVIRFRDCVWQSNYVAPVQNIGSAAQSIIFEGCNFQNLTTGGLGGVLSAASAATFVGLSFIGCWFGDATVNSGSWIDIYGAGLSFTGNYISGGASAVGTGITLRQFSGAVISGNEFDHLVVGINFAVANCLNIAFSNTPFATVTTPFQNASNVPTGQLIWYPNFGVSNPPNINHGAFGTNGCRINADGTIEQWGQVSIAAIGTPVSVTFATNGIAFPNACWNVQVTLTGFPGTNTAGATSITTTGFSLASSGTAGTGSANWRAIGN